MLVKRVEAGVGETQAYLPFREGFSNDRRSRGLPPGVCPGFVEIESVTRPDRAGPAVKIPELLLCNAHFEEGKKGS